MACFQAAVDLYTDVHDDCMNIQFQSSSQQCIAVCSAVDSHDGLQVEGREIYIRLDMSAIAAAPASV
jgi:hypothetical protein